MSTAPPASRLTPTQWLICIIAAIGFCFDIYELLMLPLIIKPALESLANLQPGTDEYKSWAQTLFFAPAVAGGVFGLLGGYLTDRLGRRRVLTGSILLYAFSACAAGFSTSLYMLLVLRCTTFIGVCVEFVAAVAWLAELFPNPKQREAVLGYTQAFSSIGGLLVTVAFGLAIKFADQLPAIQGVHEAWRYTLISGLIPAIPLILIRPFLPESPVWREKHAAGKLRRPSIAELFQPALRRTTVVTTIMFACSFGAAFGAFQQLPQIVPGLVQKFPEYEGLKKPDQKKLELSTTKDVQLYQEIGGLLGRFVLAYLAIRIASRRNLLRLFQIPGLVVVPLVFFVLATRNLELLKWGVLIGGLLTVAQFSFWGNYLPRVYPLHLRGTGESFAANIGGRLFGTSAAAISQQLALSMPGPNFAVQLANASAVVALVCYGVGLVASFFLPEPQGEALPE